VCCSNCRCVFLFSNITAAIGKHFAFSFCPGLGHQRLHQLGRVWNHVNCFMPIMSYSVTSACHALLLQDRIAALELQHERASGRDAVVSSMITPANSRVAPGRSNSITPGSNSNAAAAAVIPLQQQHCPRHLLDDSAWQQIGCWHVCCCCCQLLQLLLVLPGSSRAHVAAARTFQPHLPRLMLLLLFEVGSHSAAAAAAAAGVTFQHRLSINVGASAAAAAVLSCQTAFSPSLAPPAPAPAPTAQLI